MTIIDDVKQKTDIIEVVSQYVTLKKSGRNFSAPCPFHSERNPSFFVYPERQSWHCFGACNTGGDVLSFVMKKENMDFGEALRLLAARAGIEMPIRVLPDTRKDEKDRIFQVNSAAALYFHNLLLNSPGAENARKYLETRGLKEKTISDFQLGYALNSWEGLKEHLEKEYTEKEILEAGLLVESIDGKTHDRFRNRLIFTICNTRGRITGFGARVLDDSLPKYVNSPQTLIFDKSGTLYGINLAAQAIRQKNQVVMVEGYTDVITAHQNGITNVVASMGTAVTERQLNDLKKLTKNIVLAMDADTAGEEAMLRCVDYENSLDIELKVVVLPEGEDPDSVIREDTGNWNDLLDKSLPVMDYIFSVIGNNLDLTRASGKREAVEKIGPHVVAIPNPVRRAHFVQKLARLVGTDERTVEDTLGLKRQTPVSSKQKRMKSIRSSRSPRSLLSRPIEEQFLALLLKHPEFKEKSADVPAEYFENSENREIFLAWQQSTDEEPLKEKLDDVLCDYLDTLTAKNVLATKVNQRYNEYVLRLKEEHLRSLARKGETIKTAGEFPGEKDIELTDNLREIFNIRARREGGKGDRK
ncbi:MAG: DNA primase [Dehalococcoidales bacterium]|nr:MAG: DNA primase [Dehalococcoidales bacterium]